MLSYDIAGYFATWPQRLHALFQHVKPIENKIDNTSYSPMQHTGKSSCIQHLILHTADIHTTFKPRAPFLSALVYHGFQRAKISGSDFKIRATNFKIQGTYFLFAPTWV